MLQIANHKVLKSLLIVPYHPTLIELGLWVSHRESSFCITSGFREGDIGIHGTVPCRAIDIRSSNFESPEDVCKDINSHWLYDPKRPNMVCALYHNVGQGWHIHLQVHARTEYNAISNG